MTIVEAFDIAFQRAPLVAILRGVRPDEVVDIGEALVTSGFTLIEVPLNSPDPIESIERLATRFEGRALIGAGTVLDTSQVDAVARAGGRMIISPNADPAVIAASVGNGLVSLPGIATPTEAFGAIKAGATALKLFPAEASSPTILKALRAVVPPSCRILPVGGITPGILADWHAGGASGFGLGSALYKPGYGAPEVARLAREFIQAWRMIAGTTTDDGASARTGAL